MFSQLFGPAVPHVDTVAARAKMNDKSKVFVLDVRQPDEWKTGHIPGALVIPLNELPHRVEELPRDRQIICVCRSGNRSGAAARQLIAAGFDAVNMQGGMIAWARAGLPMKKGSSR